MNWTFPVAAMSSSIVGSPMYSWVVARLVSPSSPLAFMAPVLRAM
jgi:hypothetical protein